MTYNNRLIHPTFGPGTVLDYFSRASAVVRFDVPTEYGRTLLVSPAACVVDFLGNVDAQSIDKRDIIC